jgi:hypothetical protein
MDLYLCYPMVCTGTPLTVYATVEIHNYSSILSYKKIGGNGKLK